MVCEKVRLWSKRHKNKYILGVLDWALLRRSVFDIHVPGERFESIRNRLYGIFMLYTNRYINEIIE